MQTNKNAAALDLEEPRDDVAKEKQGSEIVTSLVKQGYTLSREMVETFRRRIVGEPVILEPVIITRKDGGSDESPSSGALCLLTWPKEGELFRIKPITNFIISRYISIITQGKPERKLLEIRYRVGDDHITQEVELSARGCHDGKQMATDLAAAHGLARLEYTGHGPLNIGTLMQKYIEREVPKEVREPVEYFGFKVLNGKYVYNGINGKNEYTTWRENHQNPSGFKNEYIYGGAGTPGLYAFKTDRDYEQYLNVFSTEFMKLQEPGLAGTLLGWMVASFLVGPLRDATDGDFRTPTIYLYGNTGAGKSTIIRALGRAFGWRGNGNGEELSTTLAANRQNLASYSAPIFLGEVESERLGSKYVQALNAEIKAVYDGMAVSKMVDNAAAATTYRGTLCMLSNFKPPSNDPAQANRRIDIEIMAPHVNSAEYTQIAAKLASVRGYIGAAVMWWALKNMNKLKQIAGQMFTRGDNDEKNRAAVAIGLTIWQEICRDNKAAGIDKNIIKLSEEYIRERQKARRPEVANFVEYILDRMAGAGGCVFKWKKDEKPEAIFITNVDELIKEWTDKRGRDLEPKAVRDILASYGGVFKSERIRLEPNSNPVRGMWINKESAIIELGIPAYEFDQEKSKSGANLKAVIGGLG